MHTAISPILPERGVVMIQWRCQCGQPQKAPESAAGKRGKCRICGVAITVPAAAGPTNPEAEGGQTAPPPGKRARQAGPKRAPPPPPAQEGDPAVEELASAFAAFRKRHTVLALASCSVCLAVLAGSCAGGVAVHWALGVFGGLFLLAAVLTPVVILHARMKKKAAAAVREVERVHGLDQEQCLELAWGEKTQANESDFKEFVAAAWGDGAYQKRAARDAPPAAVKPATVVAAPAGASREHKVRPRFGCGYCHADVLAPLGSSAVKCEKCARGLTVPSAANCPKCGGASELKEELVGGTAGFLIGGLLFGGIGAAIGQAAASKKTSRYYCAKCWHSWGVELF